MLLDLALPALRQLSGPQCTQFHQTVDALIDADGTVSLFEYMMRRILNKYLPVGGAARAAAVPAYYALKPLADDIAVVLSALASADEKDAAAVASAFNTGTARLGEDLSLSLRRPVALNAVDAAINRISQAAPGVKRRIVDACAYCVAADGVVQTEEGELLRAITTAWDCPLPPLLAQHSPVAQTA